MTFTRYEIRWTWHRSFYEGGDYLEYTPFDTLDGAKTYVSKHPNLCKSDYDNDVTCAICKVVLHSTWEDVEVLERL